MSTPTVSGSDARPEAVLLSRAHGEQTVARVLDPGAVGYLSA